MSITAVEAWVELPLRKFVEEARTAGDRIARACDYDTRKFADHFNVNHDTWWFVTGDKKDIYDFALNELKAGLADTQVDSSFIHTENFFLLDSNRIVRGWFNGFDTIKQNQLVRDIPLLMLEKDRKKPSVLREFIPILPIIFIAIGVVFVVILIFNRQKNKQEKQA